MPVVLLSVDGQDNASGALNRVASSVGNLDRSFGSLSQNSARVQAALLGQEAAYTRLASAQIKIESSGIRSAEATRRAGLALDSYQRYLDGVANSGVITTGSLDRLDTLLQATVTTQGRASSAAATLARDYRQLASAQDSVSAAGGRVNRALNESEKAPTPSGGGGGGGFGGGGFLTSMLQYQLGYGLLSTATNQLTQAFTRATDTARTFAMTAATTGISSDTTRALQNTVSQQAGSGKQPYTSDVLSAGLYAIPSAGVTNLDAIKKINDVGVKISEFSGLKDTGTVNTALIQVMSELGYTDKQMGAQVGKVGDVMSGLINLGIVTPQQVAPTVSKFGSVGAQFGVPFAESAGIMAALTKTAGGADNAALQVSRLITGIGVQTHGSQVAAKDLNIQNLFGSAGIKFFTTDLKGYLQELNTAVKGPNSGEYLKALFPNLIGTKAFTGLLGPGGSSIDRTVATVRGVATASTAKASASYESTDIAKLDDASAKFHTSVDTFSAAVTPLVTAMALFGADLLDPNNKIPKGANNAAIAHAYAGYDHGTQTAAALAAQHYFATHPKDAADAGYTAPGASAVGRLVAVAPPKAAAPAPGPYAGIDPFGPHAVAQRAAVDAQRGWAQVEARQYQNAAISGGSTGQTPGQALLSQQLGLNKNAQHIAYTDAQDRLTLAIQEKATRAQIVSALGIELQAIKDQTSTGPNAVSGVKKRLESDAVKATVAAYFSQQNAGPVVAPFKANNPGLGALEANPGNTLVRFGGGRDPLVEDNRKLRQELSASQARVENLLAQVVVNTARNIGAAAANPLSGIGANRRPWGK